MKQKIPINNFFDHIYCINLDHRTDRWEECQKEFRKNFLRKVERISAFDGKDLEGINIRQGEAGLVQTNIHIFNDAIEKDYKSILILEDDVEFSPEANIFMDFIPDDWEVLYFGGNHALGIPSRVNEKIAFANKTLATHAVGFKKNVYYQFLNILNYNQPLDLAYAHNLHCMKSYVFYPSLAWQRPSFSDINGEFVDYSYCLK